MKFTMKRSKGFTLLEMVMVLGIMSVVAMTEFSEQRAKMEQAQARQMGVQLYQYNNAARRWVAENVGFNGAQSGTTWLKEASCGGTAPTAYIPCSFPDTFAMGGLMPQTTITTTAGITSANTILPALMRSGKIRPDLAGLAALTASGGAVNDLIPAMAATDGSFTSSPLTAVITMQASTNAPSDVWLRTDGANSMHANINFDSTDPAKREITGSNRIYNMANTALTLGNRGINSNVIVDADADVMGNLTARQNLRVYGTATVDGDITGGGNATISGRVAAGTDVTAGRNVTAGQDLAATRNLTAGANAAIGGNTNIGGNTVIGGTTTSTGALRGDSNLTVAGNTDLSGSLNVSRATYLSQTLQVVGNTTIGGSLITVGDSHTYGAISASGTIAAHGYIWSENSLRTIGHVQGKEAIFDTGAFGSNVYARGSIGSETYIYAPNITSMENSLGLAHYNIQRIGDWIDRH